VAAALTTAKFQPTTTHPATLYIVQDDYAG
jgi:hypothetical protein